MTNLPVVLLAALAMSQQTDTTFAVDTNARVSLRSHEGSVRVDTWARNEVRIVAWFDDSDDEGRVEVRRKGSDVTLRPRSRWGAPTDARIELTIPRSAAIEITGVDLEIICEGVGGDVAVHSVEGDIRVTGGDGNIALNSVDGDIWLRGASGNIAVVVVDGSISLEDIEGTVAVQGVDGDIRLDGIRSSRVSVNTVDGDIRFSGPIRDGGQYGLSTHDGDLTVLIPRASNARVTVSTFSGEFEANFPVELTGEIGRRKFSFTMGTGRASLSLSAFDGLIQLIQDQ
ncbi:MAG: DUF4097 family beta strand repeat-containing protein [Gemmatimonadota bacterium]